MNRPPVATLKKLLKFGISKSKKTRAPHNGSFFSLGEKYTRKYKYQIEYINDGRYHDKPFVAVYAFLDPKDMTCRPFDYALYSHIKGVVKHE